MKMITNIENKLKQARKNTDELTQLNTEQYDSLEYDEQSKGDFFSDSILFYSN